MVVTKIAWEKPWDSEIQSHVGEQAMFYAITDLKISFFESSIKKECQIIFKIPQREVLLFIISSENKI